MAFSNPHQRCWVYFDIASQHNTPLDALSQWKDKAHAAVDWDIVSTHRAIDNVVVHVATPLRKQTGLYHPPRETEGAIFRQASRRQEEAYQNTRKLVEDWLRERHQTLVELYCEYHDSGVHGHARFSTHRISFLSDLNYTPITTCQGTGRTAQEAKNNAARNLLGAGYCMLYGQFNSPRRLVC
ncbi:hypothetical protein BDV93DRAFT_543254 [Ceratobasidium sp. AG-I]|nr:hypothetical protein BDV93DRAFT_543254 [Ceratobasidium sp. AG-I]